jgi:uncharacterized membrane protein YraQ (UPF0718 family)
MEFILNLTIQSIGQVWLTLQHNWPFLAVSVAIAALLKLYIDAERVSAFLNRYRGAGVVASTIASVATPLCSCGTTAVVLGMMASTMPWAPIVAFMVASPLTSPEGLVYSAGLFGWPFALAFYLISIFLGLAGGGITAVIESRGWLANQARFLNAAPASCACSAQDSTATEPGRVFSLETTGLRLANEGAGCGCAGTVQLEPAPACGCGSAEASIEGNIPLDSLQDQNPGSPPAATSPKPRITVRSFLKELYTGGSQLLVMFLGFAFVGYFLNGLIPPGWVSSIFGGGNLYSIPLAATLGLPLYINAETSLPLIRALMDNGMSQGAALAFMTVGAGTSIGAIAGAMTIARWRVVALVVSLLWVGAILGGYAFDLLLRIGLF